MGKVWLLMAYLNYVSVLKCSKEICSFLVTFSLLNGFLGYCIGYQGYVVLDWFEVPEMFCNFVVEKRCIKSNV